jgi:hypothetical protein
MTIQKFSRHGRIILAAFVILALISAVPAFSKGQGEKRQLVDTSLPLEWTWGYTLILLDHADMSSVNEAKDFVVESGGSIAIFSNAKAMLGWVPPQIVPLLVKKHGIVSVHYEPVDAGTLDAQDEITLSLIKFFNLVVTGEVERQYHSLRWQGSPLVNDSLEHSFVNPADVLTNLADKYVAWDAELARTAEHEGIFPGYSDSMTGTIACCLLFVESDGTIDSNLYTWTTSARDHVINQCLEGASWWANQASSNGISASFYIYYYSPDMSQMSQGYEPILHRSSDDYLWINRIMANLGYSSGTDLARVTSFNAWLKSWANTNWAYSCFFAYNPSGAPSTFTDGYFAYAYLGGPYIHMLYRNDGWSIYDIGSIFAHETGHIFWACDEYYQPGYGGCTSCAPCSSFRPVTNGNCEHPSCNPSGSVPCMMKNNSNALCSYTVAQVGWQSSPQTQILTIQSGSGGTTSPTPGSYTYDKYSSVSVTANPDANYRFYNWSGDASGTNNPITILMDRDKTIKANFLRQYGLTIEAGEGGTTSPSPGTYKYDTGSQVQVTAVPNTNYEFVNWTGGVSGTQNPVTITMDSDKTVKANFRLKPKLTIQAGTGGTTTPSPGDYYYATGAQVQVTAVPDTNYEFVNWSGSISSTQNPVTVTMDSDKTVKANFRLKPKLTIQSNEFGTTTPSPGVYYYATGTVVQVTAIPYAYSIFISWSGSATGSTNPVSLTMDSDKSLYAYFRYIYAPIATGRKVLNRTFSQAEYIDILSWQANPANDGLDISKYRIYQMSGAMPSLLVELTADQVEYSRRNAGQASIQYTIVAVTSSGREGAPATVTVQ